MPDKSLQSRVGKQGQCIAPDRDNPKLTCGYPLPCPHHDYNAADNFNRDGKNTFDKLKPETQKIVKGLLDLQAKPQTDEDKKRTLGINDEQKKMLEFPDKLPKQNDLQVKLIVVDELICFVMNQPVNWLGFDRDAAEKVGRQLIALARGTA